MKVFVAEEKTADNQCNYSSLTVCMCACVCVRFRVCARVLAAHPQNLFHAAGVIWQTDLQKTEQKDKETLTLFIAA